jgi:hypothetical protein
LIFLGIRHGYSCPPIDDIKIKIDTKIKKSRNNNKSNNKSNNNNNNTRKLVNIDTPILPTQSPTYKWKDDPRKKISLASIYNINNHNSVMWNNAVNYVTKKGILFEIINILMLIN